MEKGSVIAGSEYGFFTSHEEPNMLPFLEIQMKLSVI